MKKRLVFCLLLSACLCGPASADMFLVTTSDGPGFAAPEEVADVLEKGILPTFEMLGKLKANNKLVAGGLPVGSRKLYLVIEASSNDEVDGMLRDLPAWGVFKWKVTPLQSIEGRAAMERKILASIKAGN